jgi:hypothetical protein
MAKRDPATVFRRLALRLPESEEKSHMNHPDFRRAGRLFATLGYPGKDWGMVRLTPEQQQDLIAESPAIFTPVKGKWGQQGCTLVRLDAAAADQEAMGRALTLAWQGAARQMPVRAKRRR